MPCPWQALISELKRVQVYSWPGNVRELQHAVEHAMIIMPEYAFQITREYIPQHLLESVRGQNAEAAQYYPETGMRPGGLAAKNYPEAGRELSETTGRRPYEAAGAAAGTGEGRHLGRRLRSMEEEEIRGALLETRGNISRAAKRLEISRQNLQYRLKRYGIDPREYK